MMDGLKVLNLREAVESVLTEGETALGGLKMTNSAGLKKLMAFIRKAENQFRDVYLEMDGKKFKVRVNTGGRSRPSSFMFDGPNNPNDGVDFWGRNPEDGTAWEFFKGKNVKVSAE